MLALHGDAPLLERPFDLARAAAQGVLQGQVDFSGSEQEFVEQTN
jgi:hypothetical protein